MKWILKLGVPISVIGGLFAYLAMTGAITPLGYSGDSICAGTIEDPCYAYINFTANEDIFIYPTDYDPWGRETPMEFEPQLKSWYMQRSWGSGWRTIPLNKTCTGTWCGLSNAADERKFSIAFREGRNYSIRIVAYKNNPSDDIKWSAFDVIDPYWLGTEDDIKTKLKDKTLIDSLRTVDTFREKSKIDTYKSYDSKEKNLLIEDKDFKKLVELKLTSPYTTYVGSGESVKVAEFLLIDYKEGVDIFDGINFYDKNNDYDTQDRIYTLKYGVDYVEEECQFLPDLEKEVEYCQNVTKTNWIEFSSVSELPNRNIKIGLFTDTTLGDKVEWIPNIKGFDILEWADWDVTAGNPLKTKILGLK